MTFELDADGVRVRCTSPEWTRKLVEKGARLVDPAQAAYLGPPELVTLPGPKTRRAGVSRRKARGGPA